MCLKPFFLRKSEIRSASVSPRVRIPTTLSGKSGENEPAILVAIFSKSRRTSVSSYCVRMSHANLLQTSCKNKFLHRFGGGAGCVYNWRKSNDKVESVYSFRAHLVF